MKNKDTLTHCRLLHESFGLPLFLYQGKEMILSAAGPYLEEPPLWVKEELFRLERFPHYSISSKSAAQFAFFSSGSCKIILGPLFPKVVDEKSFREFSLETGSPSDEPHLQYLCQIPRFDFHKFLALISYLHFSLTGESIDPYERFSFKGSKVNEEVSSIEGRQVFAIREADGVHGTYFFERQLLDRGNPERLKSFLFDSAKNTKLPEGKLADSPLRQAKNLMIGLANSVGKEAAIPAGMDIEEAYRLIDIYTQQCERAANIDEIKLLQFSMLLDFCERIHQSNITANVSKEVAMVMDYIGAHIQEKILLSAIAENVNRSKSFLTSRFKSETGISINSYITKKKLEVAKGLLRHTDQTLVYIAEYLSFSSQGYFQNCFKKEFGITPAKYRRQKQAFSRF